MHKGHKFKEVLDLLMFNKSGCAIDKPKFSYSKYFILWAVVVAQLVEWSLQLPAIHSSNPVIGKIYVIEKTKIKKKEAGNGPF